MQKLKDTVGESQRSLEQQVTIATCRGVGRAQDRGEGVTIAGAWCWAQKRELGERVSTIGGGVRKMRWSLARGRWRTDTAGESQRLLERQVTIATGRGVGRAQDRGEGVITAVAVGLGTEERIESKYDRRRRTGDEVAIDAGRWAWRRNEQGANARGRVLV